MKSGFDKAITDIVYSGKPLQEITDEVFKGNIGTLRLLGVMNNAYRTSDLVFNRDQFPLSEKFLEQDLKEEFLKTIHSFSGKKGIETVEPVVLDKNLTDVLNHFFPDSFKYDYQGKGILGKSFWERQNEYEIRF
jgi:hypothetical protein